MIAGDASMTLDVTRCIGSLVRVRTNHASGVTRGTLLYAGVGMLLGISRTLFRCATDREAGTNPVHELILLEPAGRCTYVMFTAQDDDQIEVLSAWDDVCDAVEDA